jgi:outer membrane protein assembly factor BamB
MFHRLTRLITMATIITLSTVSFAGANWPAFRGADSRGIGEGANLPVEWSATKNIEWKTDIAGRGWGSPIVWGDKVFLTTAINSADTEDAQMGLYMGGERAKPTTPHQWRVICLDLESGKPVWDTLLHEGIPEGRIHVKNSFASETPVTDGKHVYAYFADLGVYCLDFNGKVVWTRPNTVAKMRNGWGTAASPILYKDTLYVVNDNDEKSYMIALNKTTGKVIWQVARDEGSNWSTPYVWENSERIEIVTTGTDQVRSYNLGGELLWTLEGMSSITIAPPYESKGVLYVTSGYIMDRSKPIYAIRSGAMGDITLKEGETSNDYIIWSNPKAAPYNPSTILVDETMYVLLDRGTVSAYKASDGTPIYEKQKLAKRSGGFTVSPWYYNGKLFCLSEAGVTYVFNEGNSPEVVQTNPLAEDDLGMATPAIVGDRLLIRTSARVYSIRNGN